MKLNGFLAGVYNLCSLTQIAMSVQCLHPSGGSSDVGYFYSTFLVFAVFILSVLGL